MTGECVLSHHPMVFFFAIARRLIISQEFIMFIVLLWGGVWFFLKLRSASTAQLLGFICNVHDHGKDIFFTIVRYSLPYPWDRQFSSITIESFSSETNMWMRNFLNLDVPLGLCPLHRQTSSAGVTDGVFCWLDQQPQTRSWKYQDVQLRRRELKF